MLTDDRIAEIHAEILRIPREADIWSFARAIEAETLKAHQQAIEAAVLAEREACAEACRGANPDAAMRRKFGDKAPYIACQNAIEARTQPMRIEDARKEET